MKKLISLFMAILLIVSFMFFISPISGAIHVYPGDDIKSIIESAPSGSTIYVHAGTYSLNQGFLTTVDNISIIGDDPYTTIIEGNGEETSASISITGKNSLIKNLTVQNFASGIYIESKSTVENCIAKNNLYSGIVVIGDNSIVKDCIAYSNQAREFLNGGIVVTGNSNRIFNCLAYKNGGVGIYIHRGGSYNSVESCTSSNGVGGAGFAIESEYTTVINCIATNNSYFGGPGIGFNVANNPSNSILYCNSWGNGDEWGAGANTPGKAPGEGCISVDPKFTTGPLGDYYLSLNSPCIDRGYLSSEYWGLQYGYITTNTGRCDTKRVDMGFHYPCNCSVPSLPIGKIVDILNNK